MPLPSRWFISRQCRKPFQDPGVCICIVVCPRSYASHIFWTKRLTNLARKAGHCSKSQCIFTADPTIGQDEVVQLRQQIWGVVQHYEWTVIYLVTLARCLIQRGLPLFGFSDIFITLGETARIFCLRHQMSSTISALAKYYLPTQIYSLS